MGLVDVHGCELWYFTVAVDHIGAVPIAVVMLILMLLLMHILILMLLLLLGLVRLTSLCVIPLVQAWSAVFSTMVTVLLLPFVCLFHMNVFVDS